MTEIVVSDIEVIDTEGFNELVISVMESIKARKESLEKKRALRELKNIKNVSKRSLYLSDLMI